MRGFCRSLFGKTVLFVLCLVCMAVGVLSIAGIAYLTSRNVYSVTAEEFLQENRSRIVSDRAEDMAYNYIFNGITDPKQSGMDMSITDPDGETVWQIQSSENPEKTISYTYFLSLETDRTEYGENIYLADWVDQSRLSDIDEYAQEAVQNGWELYTVQVAVDEKLADTGSSVLKLRLLLYAYGLRYALWAICGAAWILCIICFVLLMRGAGYSRRSEEPAFGPLFRVPYDLMVLGYIIFCCCIIGLLEEMPLVSWQRDVAGLAALMLLAALALGMCMSFASRVKQHALWKNLLTVRSVKLVGRGMKYMAGAFRNAVIKLPLVWRTALILAALSALEFLGIVWFHGSGELLVMFWSLEKIIIIPIVLYTALMLRRLQKAGEVMAAGDLHYEVDTAAMFRDFRQHAENLNSISDGMTLAVEQRLKSERMKTELITNVSHDIKTPLTSIINYTDLIIREKPENEKIAAYCEVLTRQAGKLKRLIEDLVEASKASTGNLEVNPVPCDASVFLQQAGGEYEEKLENAGLTLVTHMPEKEIMILADSRRMWRVFDNLMNNVCKYSQRGTRVYLSLEEDQNEAVITFKNTSAQQLDISPDELMERFVRGDSSRNTDGNGLGLSIARSLTELQGGTFELQVDGDLFKAILRFPVFFITS